MSKRLSHPPSVSSQVKPNMCNTDKDMEDALETQQETKSIQTDGREYDMPDNIKDYLIGDFVTNVIENLEPDQLKEWLGQKTAQEEVTGLLRDFSVLLEACSDGDETYEQVAIFVRHQRQIIAAKLDIDSKSWVPSTEGEPSLQEKMSLLWPGETKFDPPPNEVSDAADFDDGNGEQLPVTLGDILFPRDVPKARRFLLNSRDFPWLLNRLRNLSRTQQTGSTHSIVRARMADIIDSRATDGHLGILLRWDLKRFLKTQYADSKTRVADVFVFCGGPHTTYATTAEAYMAMNWPGIYQAVLECLKHACGDDQGQGIVHMSGWSLHIGLCGESTSIRVTDYAGTAGLSSLLETFECLICSATACRSNDENQNAVGMYEPELINIDGTGHHAHHLLAIPEATCSDLDAEPSDDLCWVKMVRNPVIAQGYPVPTRDETGR